MFCSYLLTLSICCLVPRQVVRGGWLMFFSAENSCLLRLTTKTETVELWPRKPKQSTHCCKKMLHRTEPQSWMLLLWWFNFIFCKTVRGKAKSNFEKQACWHPYLLLPLVSAAVFPLHVTFDLKLIQNWANWLIGQHRGRQMCSWLAMRWAACLQFFCCIETLHKKTKKQIIELIFHSPLLLSSLFVSSFLLPSPSHRKCPVLSCPVLSCPVLSCPGPAVKYSKNIQHQPPGTPGTTVIMTGQPAKHLSTWALLGWRVWSRRCGRTGGRNKTDRGAEGKIIIIQRRFNSTFEGSVFSQLVPFGSAWSQLVSKNVVTIKRTVNTL